jgi:hypothetical protein
MLCGAMGCSSFGSASGVDAPAEAPEAGADATAPVDASLDATPPDAGDVDAGATIQCGAARCPAIRGSVCCLTTSGPSCTTEAACAGAAVGCDDATDCAQLGFTDRVCCAFNDGAAPPKLTSAACVVPVNCNAAGPQDQLCDLRGPATECQVAGDGRTSCSRFTYSNSTDYAFCVRP